ncbi:VOC family protein [Myroides sp. C15-4]|uniref:VOC family protein n=1 Tax=Myroides sp. C15-4 TaxID=3400532 RepID=UPI003D2F6B50
MKILDLKLEANNLDTILEFYSETLGLKILEQTPTALRFQAGDTQLTFIAKSTTKAQYHFAFNIATNHVNQAIEWAQTTGLMLLPSPKDETITYFDTWKAQSIYFWDKNGNLLEFIAREDTQIQKEVPFTPKEMLNISEIGLITKKPIATGEAIQQQIGVDFFSKATPLAEFCALGDDDGLLILVTPNRTWYPTDILAQRSPATIQVEVEGQLHTIETLDWE